MWLKNAQQQTKIVQGLSHKTQGVVTKLKKCLLKYIGYQGSSLIYSSILTLPQE